MDLIFHGAAREVGRSCIEVRTHHRRYLLDAGVQFVRDGVVYPESVENLGEISGVFLSHAHMDHSGALPFFEHKGLPSPIYATAMTWRITSLLLEDAYHIAQLKSLHPVYAARDLRRTAADMRVVRYDTEFGDETVRGVFLNAGHIPGSASLLLDDGERRIFYTGDINTQPTLLMESAEPEQMLRLHGVRADTPLDALVIEATYGNREHPPREQTRRRFLDAIHQARERGGTVLIPCFGVGRAQEVLLMLSQLPAKIPIYLDGMARDITQLLVAHRDPYVRSHSALSRMLRRVSVVRRHDRERVVRERGSVIVSTSGMLQGGPSVYYAQQLVRDAHSTILLTGYQVNGTRGRAIWEDGVFSYKGTTTTVRCRVEKFDFSAHYGMSEIHALITQIPHRRLIIQHGDPAATEAVAAAARRLHPDIPVHVPVLGERLTL